MASCECRGECEPISEEKGDLPVHLPLGTVAEMDRQAGTRNADRKPFRDEVGDMLVRLPPGTGAEMDRRDRTINAARAIHPTTTLGPCSDSTGRYRDTAAVLNTAQTTASLNPTTDTVSQLHSKARSIQSSRSRD